MVGIKIHTTCGLYPDGSFKINGVSADRLEAHIEYNRRNRPGRALFVDGICIYKGINISEKQIEDQEQLLKSNPAYTIHEDTRPYQ